MHSKVGNLRATRVILHLVQRVTSNKLRFGPRVVNHKHTKIGLGIGCMAMIMDSVGPDHSEKSGRSASGFAMLTLQFHHCRSVELLTSHEDDVSDKLAGFDKGYRDDRMQRKPPTAGVTAAAILSHKFWEHDLVQLGLINGKFSFICTEARPQQVDRHANVP
ncbi:hypothetical protein VNO77_27067 [Canavalia gladiata]|uniref:Uncharacterized protein n=1 Tax=Canavalia gladiata TaxID=3824 RepID=A0AAN9KTG4_CANGL